MSYLLTRINEVEPVSSGNISLDISNLSDTSIASPTNNQALIYDGTNWANNAVTNQSFQYLLIGKGESNSYSNSTTSNTISANDTLKIYDSSHVNTITNASITKYSGTDWIETITLPSGNYVLHAAYQVSFSATGYLGYEFRNSANSQISKRAYMGNPTTTQGSITVIQSYYSPSSQQTIKLSTVAVSNVDTVANQGNVPSEYGSILIIKI